MVAQLEDKRSKWHTGVLRSPVMDEPPCKTSGEEGVDIIWGGRGGCEVRCVGQGVIIIITRRGSEGPAEEEEGGREVEARWRRVIYC